MGQAKKRGTAQERMMVALNNKPKVKSVQIAVSTDNSVKGASSVPLSAMVNEVFDGNFEHHIETIH